MKRDPKNSVKAINAFANRVLRRVRAAGDHTMSLDDIKQELWIAWCLACDAYDTAGGASFETFLSNGMRLHINRHLEKNIARRHEEVTALSMDMSASENRGNSEGLSPFSDYVPSDDPLPDADIEHRTNVEFALSKLSPRAQQFVSILENQPVELLEEVEKLAKRSEHAKTMGVNAPHYHRLTAAMVFDFIGASRMERCKINKELNKLSAKMARSR